MAPAPAAGDGIEASSTSAQPAVAKTATSSSDTHHVRHSITGSVVHSMGSALHAAEHAVEAAAIKAEHAVEAAAIRAEHAVEAAALRAEHAAESAAKIVVERASRRLKKLKPQRAALPGAPVHASLDALKHLVAPPDAHLCERFRDATLTIMVRLNRCARPTRRDTPHRRAIPPTSTTEQR